jgi:hypothetical protein
MGLRGQEQHEVPTKNPKPNPLIYLRWWEIHMQYNPPNSTKHEKHVCIHWKSICEYLQMHQVTWEPHHCSRRQLRFKHESFYKIQKRILQKQVASSSKLRATQWCRSSISQKGHQSGKNHKRLPFPVLDRYITTMPLDSSPLVEYRLDTSIDYVYKKAGFTHHTETDTVRLLYLLLFYELRSSHIINPLDLNLLSRLRHLDNCLVTHSFSQFPEYLDI